MINDVHRKVLKDHKFEKKNLYIERLFGNDY